MKRYGVTWETDGENWHGTLHKRFRISTWPFGNIRQCVVDIDYDGGKRGQVHVGLRAQSTRDAAMKHAIEWIDGYIKSGPRSLEAVLRDCYVNWKVLYRTRLDVIDHLFFRDRQWIWTG